MVTEMSLIIRLSLASFIAVCILPSAFAGGSLCQTCPDDPLQSPGQCNMSSTEKRCVSAICIALTAELTNGTFVGMRGCTSSGTVDCNAEGCDEYNKTLSGPVYFTRCVAECCSTSRCNKNLFPMLTGPSSTVPDMVVSSTAVPNTHPGTTQPPKGSTTFTSAGIKIKALLYLLLFLLVVLGIMS